MPLFEVLTTDKVVFDEEAAAKLYLSLVLTFTTLVLAIPDKTVAASLTACITGLTIIVAVPFTQFVVLPVEHIL